MDFVIMDDTNAHNTKLAEQINNLFKKYGVVKFNIVLNKLFGESPYIDNEYIQNGKIGHLAIIDFVYETLQHWCDDADLEKIINEFNKMESENNSDNHRKSSENIIGIVFVV